MSRPSVNSYNYNTSWEKVARLFPNSEKKLRILDLGCGDGRLVKHLTATHEVFGIDQSAEGVEQAVVNGVKATKSTLSDPTLVWPTQLDIVLALDILEHLEKLSEVLQKIKLALKEDGQLIISLPNHFDLRTRLELLTGGGIIKWSQRAYEKKAWEYSHLRFLKFQEILNMLNEHGFYPNSIQTNFMSQGLFPTRCIPANIRKSMVHLWPNAWSGKFVIRAGLTKGATIEKIILDKTPEFF